MEKHIPFRIMAMFAFFALALFLFSCEEDQELNRDLSGSWNFIEPPHPAIRLNRPNPDMDIAYDIIFTIKGREFTEVDIAANGVLLDGETAYFDGNDIVFEGPDFTMRLVDVYKFTAPKAPSILEAKAVEYTIAGESKTIGAVQIAQY
jgi:hypothetical protein